MTKEPKWRELSPELGGMGPVSVEKAAVLCLHHLEVAFAYMGCIETANSKSGPNGEDILAEYQFSIEQRRKLLLQHLDERYRQKSSTADFRDGTAAFINTISDYWLRKNDEEFGPPPDSNPSK